MMRTKNYNHNLVESKWQEYWKKNKTFKSKVDKDKQKFYVLDMFPYPSGEGLHVGHPKGYVATDIYARYMMLQNKNVLHPMGFDSFGLPAENYAIKHKIHPQTAVKKNIKKYKKQLEMFGFTYDWDREIITSDPNYYKWTQWIFLQMFKRGLAYQSYEPINWCPSCKTGLANEDLENGKCERCGTQVEKKPMRQWVLKMTDYAERLLNDLKLVNWEKSIVDQQINWIGRSEGSLIKFEILNTKYETNSKSKIQNSKQYLKVFTTRADTLFGATYMVVAPEHSLIKNQKSKIKNQKEVENYIKKAKKKSDLERSELSKKKTGVEIKGIKAINPANDNKLPIFVADYVLPSYGTGAIMAVPAHDERDFEFAKKYKLEIRKVIKNKTTRFYIIEKSLPKKKLKDLNKFGRFKIEKNFESWGKGIAVYTNLNYGKKLIKFLKNNLLKKSKEAKGWYANTDNIIIFRNKIIDISSNLGIKKFKNHGRSLGIPEKQLDVEINCFTEEGILINSGKFDGLDSKKARKAITDYVKGKETINYKMHDWVFSRQRYWGEPIPLVHCKNCGVVPVSEKDLPLKLPVVKNYQPTDSGESPLADIKNWVNTKCPKCGGSAKRETNTMPQWAGSSWYYLAYLLADQKSNTKSQKYWNKKKLKYWLEPNGVNLYVGGAEHATRHLLYARFWHKFLYDLGIASTKEPFYRLQHVGLIKGSDGRKMSKRWGNIVNPDDIISKFGADAFRMYEMFMGPFTDSIAWSTEGVRGIKRFLDKVWRYYITRIKTDIEQIKADTNIQNLLNQTINKVTKDIKNFSFNTAISSMMIFVNHITKNRRIMTNEQAKSFLKIISPFAPHITEELWSGLGEKKSIFRTSWPKVTKKIKKEVVNIAVMVNGKKRALLKIESIQKMIKDSIVDLAMKEKNVQKYTKDKKIKKIIYVSGKIVSIVI